MSSEQESTEYENLREVLKGIIGACPDVKDSPEAAEYDLNVPHRFTPTQQALLTNFGSLSAKLLAGSLRQDLGQTLEINFLGIEEEYAERQKSQGKCFRIPLTLDEQIIGWLELPSQTGMAWIIKLLGGTPDEQIDQERALSSLESGLLMDICKQVCSALDSASLESRGPKITFQPSILSAPVDLSGVDDIIEFCRLNFQFLEGELDLNFSAVLLSQALDSIAGKPQPAGPSPAETRLEMQEHINSATLPVKVKLDEIDISLKDIASMSAGDVLLLNKRIGDPIDIIISGKNIMKGLPVQYKGRYAVQTVEA